MHTYIIRPNEIFDMTLDEIHEEGNPAVDEVNFKIMIWGSCGMLMVTGEFSKRSPLTASKGYLGCLRR